MPFSSNLINKCLINDLILISKGNTILWCLNELLIFDDVDIVDDDADVDNDDDVWVWCECDDYSDIYYVDIAFFVI